MLKLHCKLGQKQGILPRLELGCIMLFNHFNTLPLTYIDYVHLPHATRSSYVQDIKKP